MTLNVSAFPICEKRLRYQRTDFNDPLMNSYWAAVCLADCFRDDELAEHGGINFGLRTEENGRFILGAMEKLFMKRQQRMASNSAFANAGLVALLGSRGIKTSALKTEDDFWTVAETLFPDRIKRNGGPTSLYVQIKNIPKKKRSAIGNANLKKVNPDWLSDAPVHVRKLQ